MLPGPWSTRAAAVFVYVGLVLPDVLVFLVLLLGFAALGWTALSAHGYLAVVLAAIAACILLGGVVPRGIGLARRLRVPLGTAGLPVTADDEPELWAAVRASAARRGLAPPDRIELTPDEQIWAHRLRDGTNILRIGMSILELVDRGVLVRLAAHETAHLAQRGFRAYGYLHAFEHEIDKRAAARRGLVRRWLCGLCQWPALRLAEAFSRRYETDADRAAGGPRRADIAEFVLTSFIEDRFARMFLVPLWRVGRRPDTLFAGLAAMAADPGFAADKAALRVRVDVLLDEQQPWQRARWTTPPLPDDEPDEPARSLLRDPAAIDRELEPYLDHFIDKEWTKLKPVSWDRVWSDVFIPATARTARALPGGLGAALDDLGAGRSRRSWLQRAVTRQGVSLQGALRAAIQMEIVGRCNGRWATSWANGLGVEWPGRPVDELVDLALTDPAAVRAELGIVQAGRSGARWRAGA
ncbi:hypothetical protein [Actinomadura atramentaria]|uniref:hypothetical protein n=1 Tax=Actinomadura atramentaria TaxID=1990 RepID=UPI0003A0CE22|nr:hypothetical protein [Actinomadura atramentaria]